MLPEINKVGEHVLSPVLGYGLIIYYLFVFCPFRAVPAAHGGSQARDLFGAIAASLHQSHRNARSEPHLQPIPQLTAMLILSPWSQARVRTP